MIVKQIKCLAVVVIISLLLEWSISPPPTGSPPTGSLPTGSQRLRTSVVLNQAAEVQPTAAGSSCNSLQQVFLLGATSIHDLPKAATCIEVSKIESGGTLPISAIASLVRKLVQGERPDVVIFSHRNTIQGNNQLINALSRAYGFHALQLVEQPRILLLPVTGIAV